jgi:hypothetical protein
LIGAVILEDRMTRQNDPEFLQNRLPEQLGNVPLAYTDCYVRTFSMAEPLLIIPDVMKHLNDTFPNRWIGRGSIINWPPRSLDLTPLDFCLWDWMKSEVYRREVDAWDEMLDRIMDAIARIKERQDELRRATRHALTRVAKCIDVDGAVFENLL